MKAWKLFLEDLEKKIGTATIQKWLSSLKIIKFDACNLYLEAENHFQAQWFLEHINPILKKGFYNENFHKIKIHLSVKNTNVNQPTKIENKFEIVSDSLDPNLLFSFFITDEKNLMTIKFLKNLTDSEIKFNPIYIYGPKGVGKTHLLQAIAHKFKEKTSKVFYVNAQTFTNHVVQSIRNSTMQEFRNKYRNLDVLIIDDIDILAKKFATQEEFFNTFNTLHSQNKLIIISSSLPCRSLTDIEERLISRFEWGISFQIEKLDKKEMKLIYKNEASLLHLDLDSDTEKFILDNFFTITSIKKAIQTISLKSHLENESKISLQVAKKYLNDLLLEEKKITINPEKIINEVSSYFNIPQDLLLGKAQTKEATLPRQFSMYLCRALLKMPFMKIGSIFKRDHSTVMTSITLIEDKIKIKDEKLTSAFFEITKKLNTSS